MKKTLLFLTLLSLFASHAQNIWREVPLSFPNIGLGQYKVGQISITDDNIVWVIANRNTTAYVDDNQMWGLSLDGGETWTTGFLNIVANPSQTGYYVQALFGVSATTAFLTADGHVFKTQDAGATWAQESSIFNDSNSFASCIHFWDENNGIVVGDSYTTSPILQVYTTTDGGMHWNEVPQANISGQLNTDEYVKDEKYTLDGSTINCYSGYGAAITSSDLGYHWTILPPSNPFPLSNFNHEWSSPSYTDSNNGLFVFFNDGTPTYTYYKTHDSGATWTSYTPTGTVRYDPIAISGSPNLYFSIGDSTANIFGSSYSVDGGQHWIDLNAIDPNPVLPYTAKFRNNRVGYCASWKPTNTFKFYKLDDPQQLFLKNPEFTSETKTVLSPNPSNGLVKINGENIQQVTLVDIQGKILFARKYVSSNEINLDISAFQNGVYFVKVLHDKGSSTLKIVKK